MHSLIFPSFGIQRKKTIHHYFYRILLVLIDEDTTIGKRNCNKKVHEINTSLAIVYLNGQFNKNNLNILNVYLYLWIFYLSIHVRYNIVLMRVKKVQASSHLEFEYNVGAYLILAKCVLKIGQHHTSHII